MCPGGSVSFTVLDSQRNTSSYRGNYYWVEFDPAIENHTNANYYISNQSFLPGNSLAVSGVNGQAASFTTDNANTFLTGMVGYLNDWQYLGEVSVAQVLGDPNLVANFCFKNTTSEYGSSAGDVKLQYQLKKCLPMQTAAAICWFTAAQERTTTSNMPT